MVKRRRAWIKFTESRLGRMIYASIDMIVVALCLPFYAIAWPLLAIRDWVLSRRPVRLDLETTHWLAKDLREDFLVVDVSRIGEGLVGVRRRRWCTLRSGGVPPSFSNAIEFIAMRDFWIGQPLKFSTVEVDST